jgi:hypothetical protein
MRFPILLMVGILICVPSFGENTQIPSNASTASTQQTVNLSGDFSVAKDDPPTDCIHHYESTKKGNIVIGVHDSLAAVAKNSSIAGLNMAAMFESEETSYLSIGENVEVILNTGFGRLTLPETFIVEFSLTDKRFTEEGRDRQLTERYVNGITARILPLYYDLNCLNSDINKLERLIHSLGFKPVTLDIQKKLSDVKKLFELNDAKGRLSSHTIAAWRQGDFGVYLTVVQAKMNGDHTSSKDKKYLYNLNFDTVYIPGNWYWTEI